MIRIARIAITATIAAIAATLVAAPPSHLTPELWSEDVKVFTTQLPKRHANAFHHLSREQFDREIAALASRVGHFDDDQMYVALERIANLVGDGHTYVETPADDAHFPLVMRLYGDDYRVVATSSPYESALGMRLVRIEDAPAASVRDTLRALTPADETTVLAETRIENYLSSGIRLHGSGIIPERSRAHYTFANDRGQEVTLDVQAVAAKQPIEWSRLVKKGPLSAEHPGESFWFVYLPESNTMFCSFRRYDDLGRHAAELLTAVRAQHPDKLVIDMRLNGGGDYTKGLRYLVEPIKKLPEINRKGHLFVMIGANTFSAAMNNAVHFRDQTAAILVGQTIGEKPNSYQEPREFTLPNSHLVVRCSTQFYEFVKGGENLVRPDQELPRNWADALAGRDAALEWILRYGDAERSASPAAAAAHP